MNPNTEIRKLRPAELYTLARILAASDSWKTLMAGVPKEGSENEPKFNSEHFDLIERASSQQRKSAAEIFLEEWSTMGKQRPTLKSTLDLLVKVELFRAADYIAVDLLQREPPQRPAYGPAARFDMSDEEIARLMKNAESELEEHDSQGFESKESLDSVLDGLGYPSELSLEFSGQSTVQHIEREVRHQPNEIIEEISTLKISTRQTKKDNSNLIQFSKSDVASYRNDHQNSEHSNNSNLIQFSSNSIRSTSITDLENEISLENGVRNPCLGGAAHVLLERQDIAYTSFSNNPDEPSPHEIIREENIRVDENGLQIWNSSDTNEYSNAGAISNSNNCSHLELQPCELPAFVADRGKSSTSVYSELKTSELPQFVVEIAHQISNQLDKPANTEPFGEPFIAKDYSDSSSNSSNFLSNVTSPSDNNTESIIPICVNFHSELSSKDNELASAELPQFVADLGHRKNNDNSTNTNDDDSEFADESSNGQYSGRFFDSKNESTVHCVGLNSGELPLVVSECNKMRTQLEEDQRELVSAELPQCVAELRNVVKK